MDLPSRIRRRKRADDSTTLVVDYEAISPVSHPVEPVGRGPVVERLLDYLDPVFEGDLPPDAYVWGPMGAGKSAVVTALFDALRSQLSESGSVIHTSTRAHVTPSPRFVYVDTRTARSPFALYHAVLDRVTEGDVPRTGIGTDELRDRLATAVGERGLLVAVDHLREPETYGLDEVRELLGPFESSLAWVAIGRDPPANLDAAVPPEHIQIPAYRRHDLVDVLTGRASEGLSERAVHHEQTRELADWAEGNAHDALAGLFEAVECADTRGHAKVQNVDLTDGLVNIPRPCQSLGRVMALSANRRRVLRVLVDLDGDERASVGSTTAAIAASGVGLSPGTIKRFLYELAESGILERLRHDETVGGNGRPPSRVEPRFPTTVFRRLHDLQE